MPVPVLFVGQPVGVWWCSPSSCPGLAGFPSNAPWPQQLGVGGGLVSAVLDLLQKLMTRVSKRGRGHWGSCSVLQPVQVLVGVRCWVHRAKHE